MNGPTKRVDHTREFVMRSWQSHSAHNSARTPDGGSHRQKKRNLIHVAPIATALIHPLWVNFQGRYSSDTDRNTTGISDPLKGINSFPDPSGNPRIERGTVRESARLATPARDTPSDRTGAIQRNVPVLLGVQHRDIIATDTPWGGIQAHGQPTNANHTPSASRSKHTLHPGGLHSFSPSRIPFTGTSVTPASERAPYVHGGPADHLCDSRWLPHIGLRRVVIRP